MDPANPTTHSVCKSRYFTKNNYVHLLHTRYIHSVQKLNSTTTASSKLLYQTRHPQDSKFKYHPIDGTVCTTTSFHLSTTKYFYCRSLSQKKQTGKSCLRRTYFLLKSYALSAMRVRISSSRMIRRLRRFAAPSSLGGTGGIQGMLVGTSVALIARSITAARTAYATYHCHRDGHCQMFDYHCRCRCPSHFHRCCCHCHPRCCSQTITVFAVCVLYCSRSVLIIIAIFMRSLFSISASHSRDFLPVPLLPSRSSPAALARPRTA